MDWGSVCTDAGVALAGVPLLYRTRAGVFRAPGRMSEIDALLVAAYGTDPTRLRSRSSRGSPGRSIREILRALRLRRSRRETPELNQEAAARLARAAERLAKFDPDETRDWHGRWTSDGRPVQGDSKQRVADQECNNYTCCRSRAQMKTSEDISRKTSTFTRTGIRRKIRRSRDQSILPKQVIQFGDWLGRAR